MRTYRFYKDEFGWFIDLKWFPFNRAHLAMVCGADEMLDKLSNNGTKVKLQVSTKPIKVNNLTNFNCLIRETVLGLFYGAIYSPTNIKLENKIFKENQLYLCAVTLLLFGRYPKKLYFNVL